MRKFAVAGFIAVAPGFAWAQADAKDEGLKVMGLDVTGYVDASYNHLSRSNLFTGGAPSRVFDLRQEGFDLQQAAVKISKTPPAGFGGVLNLTAGRDADVIASYKTDPQKGKLCNVVTGLNADGSTCDRDHFDVTQAYGQYANGPWTIIAGKYVTLAGAEVIWTPSNTNFSHSILFGYAIPFSHTGVRAIYAPADNMSFIAGVVQGWDAVQDTNGSKTLELGATWSPMKQLSIAAQGYFGKERAAGLTKTELPAPLQLEGSRKLFDAVVTWNATDKLQFILNYDHGSQDNAVNVTPNGVSTATWDGFAAYAIYQLNDQWRFSTRAEYFNDKDGYRTGLVQKWKEGTITVSWLPTKPIELRAEYRRDKSDVPAFLDRNGTVGHDDNTSYGLQFLYKF